MSDKRPATDGDRLPWLGPMPDRAAAPGPRAAVRGLTILVLLLTVALTGTLSLLLLRDRDGLTTATPAAPPAQPIARVDMPVRPAVPPPAVPLPAPPATLAEVPAPSVKPQAPAKQVRAKSKKSVKKARVKKPRASARRASPPQVRVHRGTRNWPAAPRGRVIQLGAYNSAGQAYNAWRGTVRDYPYLGTLPRRITPIRVGPNRRLYYRLQVATPSRRHAEPVCRVVRATRRACLVRR